MHIRNLTAAIAGLFLSTIAGTAPLQAQGSNVRFVLDFLLQGQQSAFVLGREKGYYAAQKVNLTAFDPGRGGADSITKVASGTHDVGFGDLSAMIEFNARNPGQELIAVLLMSAATSEPPAVQPGASGRAADQARRLAALLG